MSIFRRFCEIIALGLMVWSLPAESTSLEITDHAGRIVRLDRPAQRIVSLAPHITELLYEAGAGSQIVGTVDFSDYPESARKIPRIGSFDKFDFEAIVALKPDIVIAWHSGNPADRMRAMHQLGVPVFYNEPKRLDDIADSIEAFGHLAGTVKRAHEQAGRFRARLASLRQAYASRTPVRVFYQVWDEPLMTVNGQHIISDAISLCGGVNVFADLAVSAPRVDMESLLQKNPQVIIAGINAQRSDWLQQWRDWPNIAAVGQGHVYGVDPDLMTRHTSRILTGTRQVCDFIDKARD